MFPVTLSTGKKEDTVVKADTGTLSGQGSHVFFACIYTQAFPRYFLC